MFLAGRVRRGTAVDGAGPVGARGGRGTGEGPGERRRAGLSWAEPGRGGFEVPRVREAGSLRQGLAPCAGQRPVPGCGEPAAESRGAARPGYAGAPLRERCRGARSRGLRPRTSGTGAWCFPLQWVSRGLLVALRSLKYIFFFPRERKVDSEVRW